MSRLISRMKKQPELPMDYDDLKPRRRPINLRKLARNKIVLAVLGIVALLCLFGTLSRRGPTPQSDLAKKLTETKAESVPEQVSESVSTNSQLDVPNAKADQPEISIEDSPMPKSVELFDLADSRGSQDAVTEKQMVLLLIPLRNCEKMLPLMFRNMMNMTYDHSLIDVAFLVSDCSKGDKTYERLVEYTNAMQRGKLLPLFEAQAKKKHVAGLTGSSDLYQRYMPKEYLDQVENIYKPPYHDGYTKPFHNIEIYKKDFGQVIGQGFSDRHDVKIQGIRRKLMGRARNWLLTTALKPYHSWVYWRDVDIELCPGDILEFMMKFTDKFDVVVPNIWRPLPTFLGGEQPYDLNSWIESDEALKLAKTLDDDDVIVEGYAEYPTWRAHLAYIRDPDGNKNEIVALDGVGGVSILAKAQVFRAGAMFPAFTFLNHAETEAFGKMCKRMGFGVGGLPHYTVWHVYEPSQDDLQKISKMERKKRRFGSSQ